MGDESVHMPAPSLLSLIKLYVTVSKRFVMNLRILCLNPPAQYFKRRQMSVESEVVTEVALGVCKVSLLKQSAYSNMCPCWEQL